MRWLYLLMGLWLPAAPVLGFRSNNDDRLFVVPEETGLGVEFYDRGDSRIAIFMHKATWHEAKKMCGGQGGALIEYVTEDIPVFVGRALAESAIGYNSLWVGGEFIPSGTKGDYGEWRWTKSRQTIDAELTDVREFPMMTSPFWVDRPDPTASTPLCLATDRNMHHLALIVAEPCNKKRPFICTLAAKNGTDKPKPLKPSMKVGTKKFHLFIAQVTWDEALNHCHEIGMKLAKVATNFEFEMLMHRMQRARPIMENAWVSGAFIEKWVWIENYEAISVDPSKYNETYPNPWYRPDNIILDGCLLVDRHVCNRLVYVEARCDRLRNYICEEARKIDTIKPPIVPVPGYPTYYISSYMETWTKAASMCAKCLNGELVIIEMTRENVMEKLPMLYTAMALTLSKEIRHVWMGGYLFSDKFKWTVSEAVEPDDSAAISAQLLEDLSGSGENGILTYCESNFKLDRYLLDHKCLNMDRENQKNFMLYGLKCKTRQHYLCHAPPNTTFNNECLTAAEHAMRRLAMM